VQVEAKNDCGGTKIHIFNIYTIKKRLWRLIRPHYVGLKLV
jgi:hypothetical protein